MLQKILLLAAIAGATWWYLRLRAAAQSPAGTNGAMTVAQAAAVLGISPGADEAEIVAAHRRLITANHPDKGGTDYLAQQINEARAVLTRAARQRS
jgi:DnaJ-domain-containing protein 1